MYDTLDIFRDDGIVIAITFWQWIIEFIFNLLGIGMILALGANRKVDHFLALFNIWVGTSVVPSSSWLVQIFEEILRHMGY